MLASDKSARKLRLSPLDIQESYRMERIVSTSRILIIEGISGSGKDTLQRYLKRKLKDKVVYDYSEGEVLQSWNQLQIKGIINLQIKLMKLFVNYMRDIISGDENAVFILNRFHLSAYVLAVAKQPRLAREYNEIINSMRDLPVHVFILQLDENEIEKRSLHPERSGAWQKFQHQIVMKEGFHGRLERYAWQQRLMLETAGQQKIPYSIVKFPSAIAIEGGRERSATPTQANLHRVNIRPFRRKRMVPQNS